MSTLKGYYTEFPNYTPRPGGAEYRRINTNTEKGLALAEDLRSEGWAIASVGFFQILLWRPKNESER